MNWKVIIFLLLILVPLISSEDISCNLVPHYINQGSEIQVYDNQTFDGVYFQILCSDNLNQRILSVSVTNASPIEFYNSLPHTTIPYLAIKNKIMWTSEIVPTSFNSTYVNFSADVLGLSENYTLEKVSASKVIQVNKEEDKITNFAYSIFPSHPILGIFIVVILIIFAVLVLWNYEIGKKLGGWKRKRQMKKMEKQQKEEKFRRMR